MRSLIVTCLSITFVVPALMAQRHNTLDQITVNGRYKTSLSDFLLEQERQHRIEIQFDEEDIKGIQVDQRFFDVPIRRVIQNLAKEHKLNYTIDDTGIIRLYKGGIKHKNANIDYKGEASAFNISVSGKVSDSDTGESLPFVNIRVKATSSGTTSNVDGFFTLLKVPTDTSTLQLSYIGYNDLEIKLNPLMPKSSLKVVMTQASTHLDEVVIRDKRDEVMQVNEAVSMVKLTPAKLNLLPNLGEKDIFRSLQLMPGVSAANENSSGLYVRGGTPDQALVTYDGFTVYHVDHLFGFYSAFNSNAIKDVNLYKGGFSPKFGGRVSSVAEITGKDGNLKEFNIGGDVSLLSANLFMEVPLVTDKLTLLIAGRKSWKGPLYNSIFDTFGPEENQVPTQAANRPGFSSNTTTIASYFYDVNGKLTYKPSDKDVISLSFYNGKDDLDNSSEIPSFGGNFGNLSASTSDVTQWGNTGSSLKWSRQWNNRLYTNTLFSYSNYFSNRDRSNSRTITPDGGESLTIKTGLIEDNNIDDLSFKAGIEYKLSAKHSLELGTHLTRNTIDYSYSQNDTISIIDRSQTADTYAFYLNNKSTMFKGKMMINRGLRYTYYQGTDEHYFEPRISANYFLTDKITLKAAAGRYYQFAKRVIREDVLQGSRDFWQMADGELLPVTHSDQLILGASYETNGFLFDMEGYYKRLDGLSEYSLRFTTDQGGISYEDSFLAGTGSTKGIDFMVQKNHGNYTGWVSYTLSQTLYNFPVYQQEDFHASHDVTNEINFVNMYKLGKWDFSLTWIYATGRPYTEPTGGYSVELLDGNSQDFVSVSTKNGVRFPDYHRLDAAVTYSWKGKRGGTNSLGMSLFNLYNRKNTWYKEFQIEEDELIETKVNYLGFTPNLTLSIKLK